ncbi:MAG: response regulator transcription factor [Chloroflexi bacterium]|nr:response regulator transcription factor [Chloroflexota bacterium]
MSEALHLVLVDDDPERIQRLPALLSWANFTVDVVDDAAQAAAWFATHTPHIAVLNANLDARGLLTSIRAADNWVPVVVVGTGDATERTLALEKGADAYLNTPFDPKELIALLRAILRRVEKQALTLDVAQRLLSRDLMLDRLARRLWRDGTEITLTPKAFALLEYLMTHPHMLLTRAHLLDAVWGWDYPAGERAVDTRIFELRRALGDPRDTPQYIETLPGQGYRYIAPVEIGR